MLTPGVRTYVNELVLRNIDKYFDQDTYERIQSERPSNDEINGLVRTKVDEFTL